MLIAVLAAVLGLGTALVYPTFLASIAALSHPEQRAESLGTFRFWRDMGYAIGALFSGILTDYFNIQTAIVATGLLTIISAVVIQLHYQTQIQL